MNLITTSAIFKQAYSAIDVDFALSSIKSFIDDADENYIIPVIGRTTFDKVISLGEGTSTAEKVIVNLLRKAEANFAVNLYVSAGSVNISDAGISVSKTEKSLPASDKKLVTLKSDTIEAGFNLLYNALDQIEANKDALDYNDTQERAKNLAMFINNAREFQMAGINIGSSNNLYQTLRTYQFTPEVYQVEKLLGNSITQTLRNGILNNELEPLYAELLKKVRRAVAPLTMVEAIPFKVVAVNANGVFTTNHTDGGSSSNIENRNPASENNIQRLINKCQEKADLALLDIENYLNENAEDLEIQPKGEPIKINEPGSKFYYM